MELVGRPVLEDGGLGPMLPQGDHDDARALAVDQQVRTVTGGMSSGSRHKTAVAEGHDAVDTCSIAPSDHDMDSSRATVFDFVG